jgi:hypothetical protein
MWILRGHHKKKVEYSIELEEILGIDQTNGIIK